MAELIDRVLRLISAFLVCALFLPAWSAQAEVSLSPPSAVENPLPLPKLDRPSSSLIVPFFEVDTNSPNGTTTLYAIRNITDLELTNILVSYIDEQGNSIFQQIFNLDPQETRSVNVRDIPNLPADASGIARGGILISASVGFVENTLSGDFFQVDVAGRFATGERLVSLNDLCLEHEIRFLDFGSGTNLKVFIAQPRGGGGSAPPSFTVEAFDESGTSLSVTDVRTDQVVLGLEASDFTSENFGTLVFDFRNSQGGYVFAEYSADGLFSVGVNSACRVPPVSQP